MHVSPGLADKVVVYVLTLLFGFGFLGFFCSKHYCLVFTYILYFLKQFDILIYSPGYP